MPSLLLGPRAAASPAVLAGEGEPWFCRKNRDRHGSLSLDESLSNLPDKDAAMKRFEKWVTDEDGRLSKAECMNMGH